MSLQALLTLARHDRSRECLLLLEAILEPPGLAPRLSEVLLPKLSKKALELQPNTVEPKPSGSRQPGARKQGARQ